MNNYTMITNVILVIIEHIQYIIVLQYILIEVNHTWLKNSIINVKDKSGLGIIETA